jgi:hypothetical protein
MKNIILEELVRLGTIKEYQFTSVDSFGNSFGDSDYNDDSDTNGRNNEVLKLSFNDGSVIKITSFCSGAMENTNLIID